MLSVASLVVGSTVIDPIAAVSPVDNLFTKYFTTEGFATLAPCCHLLADLPKKPMEYVLPAANETVSANITAFILLSSLLLPFTARKRSFQAPVVAPVDTRQP
ncbi:hypothetical protein D9M68_744490 [compost metagenome]